MDAPQLAALAIIVATGMIIFMDWVPTPLNRNIAGMTARERMPSTVIHGSLGVLFVSANLLEWTWVILVGALWYTVVLAQAIRNWWLAYVFEVYSGEITPDEYRLHYAANVRVLPRIGDHPVVPDLQHILIHLSVLAAAVLSWFAFVDLR
jgi:hypothetical protein